MRYYGGIFLQTCRGDILNDMAINYGYVKQRKDCDNRSLWRDANSCMRVQRSSYSPADLWSLLSAWRTDDFLTLNFGTGCKSWRAGWSSVAVSNRNRTLVAIAPSFFVDYLKKTANWTLHFTLHYCGFKKRSERPHTSRFWYLITWYWPVLYFTLPSPLLRTILTLTPLHLTSFFPPRHPPPLDPL